MLTAWAVSALISDAAAAAWIDPEQVQPRGRPSRPPGAIGPAFPLSRLSGLLARAIAGDAQKQILQPRPPPLQSPRRQTLASHQIGVPRTFRTAGSIARLRAERTAETGAETRD